MPVYESFRVFHLIFEHLLLYALSRHLVFLLQLWMGEFFYIQWMYPTKFEYVVSFFFFLPVWGIETRSFSFCESVLSQRISLVLFYLLFWPLVGDSFYWSDLASFCLSSLRDVGSQPVPPHPALLVLCLGVEDALCYFLVSMGSRLSLTYVNTIQFSHHLHLIISIN